MVSQHQPPSTSYSNAPSSPTLRPSPSPPSSASPGPFSPWPLQARLLTSSARGQFNTCAVVLHGLDDHAGPQLGPRVAAGAGSFTPPVLPADGASCSSSIPATAATTAAVILDFQHPPLQPECREPRDVLLDALAPAHRDPARTGAIIGRGSRRRAGAGAVEASPATDSDGASHAAREGAGGCGKIS